MSSTPVFSNDYKERISYDPNGNILSYLRNGHTQGTSLLPMDDLTYTYESNANRLKRVTDNPAYTNNYPDDIDNQSSTQNYTYDLIGNLVTDNSEGITAIDWTVYGKIKSITKNSGSINYTYDASGNRISKTFNGKTTWYVRDASGNVMSTYEYGGANNSGHLTQTEIHLYGSSRLGILNTTTNVQDILLSPDITTVERGNKNYELSNHLGNVLATVSDRKLQHDAGNGTVDYYQADVLTANDYYPFGSQMPNRKFSSSGVYRYGFNGKENDNEVKGEGNQQDYGMRIYDPRLGKFLSVDPLQKNYPFLTPYNFVANSPLALRDYDGKEIIINYRDEKGRPQSVKYTPGVKPSTANKFVQQVHEAVTTAMKNDDSKTFQKLHTNSKSVNIFETASRDPKIANQTQGVAQVSGSGTITSMEVTITWNPNVGLKTTSGGGQSASTLLLHEGDHADKFINAKKASDITKVPTGNNYDDTEEQRVIDGVESNYINKTNSNQPINMNRDGITMPQTQAVRNDHRGTYYPTNDVNSIVPTDNTVVAGVPILIKTPDMKSSVDNTKNVIPVVQ